MTKRRTSTPDWRSPYPCRWLNGRYLHKCVRIRFVHDPSVSVPNLSLRQLVHKDNLCADMLHPLDQCLGISVGGCAVISCSHAFWDVHAICSFLCLRLRLRVQRAGPSACVPVFEVSQFVSLPLIHIYGEILTRKGYDESNRRRA